MGAERPGREGFHFLLTVWTYPNTYGRWSGAGTPGGIQGSLEGGSVGWKGQGILWEIASKPGQKGHDKQAQLSLKPELFFNGTGGLWRE